MVGIKGTGMSALAEVLKSRGALVFGSDVADHFYTEDVLTSLSIPFKEGFSADNLPRDTDLVVYSAAYNQDSHPELIEARRREIHLLSYTEALGLLSGESFSLGVAGVHGKTTTTAMIGACVKKLGIPATVIAGSAAMDFGGRSTLVLGERFLVAETCEYRRHFLSFKPAAIVLTSVEPDHLDYFKGFEDILDAFVTYCLSLPAKGTLIYCADDTGAVRVAETVKASRPDLGLVPYGEAAGGPFLVSDIVSGAGKTEFKLAGFDGTFELRVPGRHNVKNAAAAAASAILLLECEGGIPDHSPAASRENAVWSTRIIEALRDFRGTKRRSEVLGEARGVLFLDDYGHHPTAIKSTLEGIKDFYYGRRIVLDFMSHTYSRTRQLLNEFAESLASADAVILHKIYASAREESPEGSPASADRPVKITGRDLYEKAKDHCKALYFYEEVMDALEFCTGFLKPGDIFVTMGAGDNWKLGRELYGQFLSKGEQS